MSVGVALITHNARDHLPYCLPPLITSPLNPKILLVNSSSTDGTVELAKSFGVETRVIPRRSFNHGITRELARKALQTEIVVMATPDAYPLDNQVLGRLIQPILDKKSSLAYARQVPHWGASLWEAFPRSFNYPEQGHIRSLQDVDRYGVYTFFASDSFCAYDNGALDAIGGFKPVLIGEDTVACAELLLKGHRIAYVAEAEVRHSHSYTLFQEFERHFDTGLARAQYQDLISLGGKDRKRGVAYLKALLSHLAKTKPHLIPYALLQSGVKWAGYQLGKASRRAPKWFKKRLSGQDFYWG